MSKSITQNALIALFREIVRFASFSLKQDARNTDKREELDRKAQQEAEKRRKQVEKEKEKKQQPRAPDLPVRIVHPGGLTMSQFHNLGIRDVVEYRLCGEIYAGDACVIFAPTNLGKSIAAMQIALDIAWARPSTLFPPLPIRGMENEVYIYDQELRPEQIANRYPKGIDYPENLHRFSPYDGYPPKTEVILSLIEDSINEATINKTWVIDNLTSLLDNNGNDEVSRFLKRIKVLQAQMYATKGLFFTCILVAHASSSKVNKSFTGELTDDMIMGNTILGTFADVIFGIHRSSSTDLRDEEPYFQIIKARENCQYSGFMTKRVSSPYAMLQYNDSIDENLLNMADPIDDSIDFSPAGIDFMMEYLYMECGLSLDDIGKLYHCSNVNIKNHLEARFGPDYALLKGKPKDLQKGHEYFRNRMKYIYTPSKDEDGVEQKDL